jgi:hypothetical protein
MQDVYRIFCLPDFLNHTNKFKAMFKYHYAIVCSGKKIAHFYNSSVNNFSFNSLFVDFFYLIYV